MEWEERFLLPLNALFRITPALINDPAVWLEVIGRFEETAVTLKVVYRR
jgi:hypothetical protein